MGVLKLYLMTLLCVAFVKAQSFEDFTFAYTNSPKVQDTTTMFTGSLSYNVAGSKLTVTSFSISGLKSPSSATATRQSPNTKKYTLFVVFPVLTVTGFVSLRGSTQTSSVTLYFNNVRFMGTRDDRKQTVTGSIIGIGETNVPVPPCSAPPNSPIGVNTANTCGNLATYCTVNDGRNVIMSQLGKQCGAAVVFNLSNLFF